MHAAVVMPTSHCCHGLHGLCATHAALLVVVAVASDRHCQCMYMHAGSKAIMLLCRTEGAL